MKTLFKLGGIGCILIIAGASLSIPSFILELVSPYSLQYSMEPMGIFHITILASSALLMVGTVLVSLGILGFWVRFRAAVAIAAAIMGFASAAVLVLLLALFPTTIGTRPLLTGVAGASNYNLLITIAIIASVVWILFHVLSGVTLLVRQKRIGSQRLVIATAVLLFLSIISIFQLPAGILLAILFFRLARREVPMESTEQVIKPQLPLEAKDPTTRTLFRLGGIGALLGLVGYGVLAVGVFSLLMNPYSMFSSGGRYNQSYIWLSAGTTFLVPAAILISIGTLGFHARLSFVAAGAGLGTAAVLVLSLLDFISRSGIGLSVPSLSGTGHIFNQTPVGLTAFVIVLLFPILLGVTILVRRKEIDPTNYGLATAILLILTFLPFVKIAAGVLLVILFLRLARAGISPPLPGTVSNTPPPSSPPPGSPPS